MKHFLWLLLLPLILGCNHTSPSTQKHAAEPGIPPENEAADEEDLNVYAQFDVMKQLTQQWNTAINEQNAVVLNRLYADHVTHYLNEQTKQQCIESKLKWLGAHPDYRQTVEGMEVYYMETDTDRLVFMVDFDKVYTENGLKKRTSSTLVFTKYKDDWKITQETDLPTQLSRAQKAPPVTLPDGEYFFYLGYWCDTRDLDDFAHQEVPYRFSIDLHISGDTITGDYAFYSGTMRSWIHHLIIGGNMQQGILTLETIYNENEQHTANDYPTDAETSSWQYKIISSTELVGIDASNSYLYGKSLWLEERMY